MSAERTVWLEGAKRTLILHLRFALVTWLTMCLLMLFNIVHWALWAPGLIANTGLLISLIMQQYKVTKELLDAA